MGGPSASRVIDPVVARLRDRRWERGLTQKDLATLAETQQSAISDMETGASSPTLMTLRKVAVALKVDLEVVDLTPSSIKEDIEYLGSLDVKQLEQELLVRRWYSHPNDLIGGYCVMPVDAPPSSGCFSIADFMTESWTAHIVQLHNSTIDRSAYVSSPDDRDPDCVINWPGCFNGGYSPDCCRFPKSCSC